MFTALPILHPRCARFMVLHRLYITWRIIYSYTVIQTAFSVLHQPIRLCTEGLRKVNCCIQGTKTWGTKGISKLPRNCWDQWLFAHYQQHVGLTRLPSGSRKWNSMRQCQQSIKNTRLAGELCCTWRLTVFWWQDIAGKPAAKVFDGGWLDTPYSGNILQPKWKIMKSLFLLFILFLPSFL